MVIWLVVDKMMIEKILRGEEVQWQPKRGTYLGQDNLGQENP